MPTERQTRLRRLATAWGAGVGALVYFAVLLDLGTDITRTAVAYGFASNFFDVQAQAFMRGHLDVPAGTLGIEGFRVDGRTYEYFPPFPALLRIPFMLITHEFDGRLTLVSMALAWVVFATLSTKLLWLVRDTVAPTAPMSRGGATALGLLLATVTGGTVLVFDASLPWSYHEVYLWSTALTVGAVYWMVRVGLDPSRTAVSWLAGLDLATVLTRTTSGFAVCGASVLLAIWLLLGRTHRDRRRTGWSVLAAGLVPVAIAVAYNMVKFGHPYLFPLEKQVFTQLSARRREALSRNGGTITGPQFLRTGLVNYLRPDGIRFTSYFPWISLPARPARAYGGAFLDQSYRTGSATAFMPLLFLGALWGTPVAFWPRHGDAVRALRFPLLGTLLIPLGVLDYGYVAHRYLSEFVPWLVVGAMIGVVDVVRRLDGRRRAARLTGVAGIAVLAVFGLAANAATGLTSARQTAGGARLTTYLSLQERLSRVAGDPVASLVTRSDTLPSTGRTDELHIVGPCDALYVDTGDAYQPWTLVEQRLVRVRVVIGTGTLHRASVDVLRFRSQVDPGRTLPTASVEIGDGHRIRVALNTSHGTVEGAWTAAVAGQEVDVAVAARPDYGVFTVSALPGGPVGSTPSSAFDADFRSRPVDIVDAADPAAAFVLGGGRVERGATPLPDLCHRLAADAGVDVGP